MWYKGSVSPLHPSSPRSCTFSSQPVCHSVNRHISRTGPQPAPPPLHYLTIYLPQGKTPDSVRVCTSVNVYVYTYMCPLRVCGRRCDLHSLSAGTQQDMQRVLFVCLSSHFWVVRFLVASRRQPSFPLLFRRSRSLFPSLRLFFFFPRSTSLEKTSSLSALV